MLTNKPLNTNKTTKALTTPQKETEASLNVGRYSSSSILQLQMKIGNRATAQLIGNKQKQQSQNSEATTPTVAQDHSVKPVLQMKNGSFVNPVASSDTSTQVIQRTWVDKGEFYEWDEAYPDGTIWRSTKEGKLYYNLRDVKQSAIEADPTYEKYAEQAKSWEEWIALTDINWDMEKVSALRNGEADVESDKDKKTEVAEKPKMSKHQKAKAKHGKASNKQKSKPVGAGEESKATKNNKKDDDEHVDGEQVSIEFLANLIGYEPEQLNEIIEFASLDYYLENYVQEDYKDIGLLDELLREIKGNERKMEQMPDPGSGKRANGDWAAKSVREEAKKVALDSKGEKIFEGGKYTLHHKISRKQLRDLYRMMNKDMESGAAAGSRSNPLDTFLSHDMLNVLGTSGTLKNLLSMPGNLEIGPEAELRSDDPREGFDGNYESGKMTPRSQLLSEVDRMITAGAGIDFAEVTKRLKQVQAIQNVKLKGKNGKLTTPSKGTWEDSGGSKFHKSGGK